MHQSIQVTYVQKLLATTNCVQKLLESDLTIVSATKEYTSVEETNSKVVKGLIHMILPYLSDAHLNPEIVRKPSGGHSNTNKVYHGHR